MEGSHCASLSNSWCILSCLGPVLRLRSAVREWCLAFHDVRACAVEVVCWWDELQHMGGLPQYEQQALALEVGGGRGEGKGKRRGEEEGGKGEPSMKVGGGEGGGKEQGRGRREG